MRTRINRDYPGLLNILCFFTFMLFSFSLLGQNCGSGDFENLIANGDFGSGEDSISFDTTGFTSNQIFSSEPPPNEGFYTLTNNTSTWGAFASQNWINIGDNSGTANGYMMVVNMGEDSIFYEKRVPICPATPLVFSLDLINLFDTSQAGGELLPNIELWINGQREAILGELPKGNGWQSFTHSFLAPEVDSISIRLINTSSGLDGNDFAMDNLSLKLCPPQISLSLSDNQSKCPGDDISLTINSNDAIPDLIGQLELSLDGGNNWSIVTNPMSLESINIDNIPPNARYRLRVATQEAFLEEGSCFFYSSIFAIPYTDPDMCNEVIESIGELCEGSRGDNIFEDGSFGSGTANIVQTNPGLAPGYGYQSFPPPNDGNYNITNNTSSWGSFAASAWINIQDNSDDPFGYMMVVNAAFDPGIFYEKTVPVCENTNYEFSADIINLIIPGVANHIPPNISFLINGQEIYTSGDVPQDGEWHTYGITFTTRFGTEAIQLTLRNNAPGGIGNDLALDNIIFRPCGPKVELVDTTEICLGRPELLNASVSLDEDFPNLALQWQKSTTEGLLWENLEGEGDSTLFLEDPMDGDWYRLKIANREANINNSSCFFFSNITALFNSAGQSDLVDTLCMGEQVDIAGNRFDTSGYYEVNIPLANGCDSLVTLDLLVNPSYDLNLDISLCESDTFQLGSQQITSGGAFSQLFQSAEGCDSLVNIEITIEPEYQFTDTTILCYGEAYEGSIYFEDTLAVDYLMTQEGCDSILATYFKILPSQNQTFVRLVCPGDSFNGTTVNNDTLVSVGGFNGITCDSVTLYELQLYDDPAPEISGPDLICEEEEAVLEAPGFSAYEWSNGANTPVINVGQSGLYAVTLTSSNNCLYYDSLSLRVVDFQVDLTSKQVACFGENNGSILINNIMGGDAPYQMQFGNAPLEAPGDLINLSAGIYPISFFENNGCDYTDTLEILQPDLFTIELSPDQSIILGDSIQLAVEASRGAQEIQWSPERFLSCTDCPYPYASPVDPITYEVLVRDSADCEASGRIRVEVQKNRRVYLPNVFSPNGDGVNDVFKPFMANNIETILQFVILDRWGNLLKEVEDLSPNDIQLEWDGTHRGELAPMGTYIWTLEVVFKDQKIRRYAGDVVLMR